MNLHILQQIILFSHIGMNKILFNLILKLTHF